MKIGVLAVQGAFIEHIAVLRDLGAECVELRQKKDVLQDLDGLVLPGGESTVQGKLLRDLDMFSSLKGMIESGTPVLATCAGLILLADQISNDNKVYFATMPMTVRRNAYGRQLGSFHTEAELFGMGNIPMTFIRAPYIESVGEGVEILSKVGGKIVAARYKNQLALSFHPELDENRKIHKYFLAMCEENR